jgi:hypothetical protein
VKIVRILFSLVYIFSCFAEVGVDAVVAEVAAAVAVAAVAVADDGIAWKNRNIHLHDAV